jgi:zinc finger-like protein
MAQEESEVLPVLMRSLCMAEQRDMVWRILRAMPLRLLERVMPWVAGGRV